MPTFDAPVAVSTSASGLNTESDITTSGAYQLVVVLDTAIIGGDTVEVQFVSSVDGGSTGVPVWSTTLDSSTPADTGILSPVVPITDATWGQVRSDATVTGTVDWRFQLIRVADLDAA